eukprot:TRINITY_DN29527_c0_g1_i1.p1 TRINITY_DN29527_c0_g1~~TRINITY_DN29527_c0_g1_i1.p1  ORF type:complete len:348 (+),score=56.64 TRINITY_DN29527_c0_g1_i1:51-1094(+)
MDLALKKWQGSFRREVDVAGRPGSRSRPASASSSKSLKGDMAELTESLSLPTSLRPRSPYGLREKSTGSSSLPTLTPLPLGADAQNTSSQQKPKGWLVSPADGGLSSSLCSQSWGPGWNQSKNGQIAPLARKRRSARELHHAAMLKVRGMDHSQSDASTIRVEFQKRLLRYYKNIVLAWCQLDRCRNGRCIFPDVVRVAQECDFVCNMTTLWKALEYKGDHGECGFVRFENIDPEAAELLRGFTEACAAHSGSAEEAWRRLFVTGDENLRCRKEPFKAAARKLAYDGDVDAVFAALNIEASPAGVMFEEFALLDKWFADHRSQRSRSTLPGLWDAPAVAPNPMRSTR